MGTAPCEVDHASRPDKTGWGSNANTGFTLSVECVERWPRRSKARGSEVEHGATLHNDVTLGRRDAVMTARPVVWLGRNGVRRWGDEGSEARSVACCQRLHHWAQQLRSFLTYKDSVRTNNSGVVLWTGSTRPQCTQPLPFCRPTGVGGVLHQRSRTEPGKTLVFKGFRPGQ